MWAQISLKRALENELRASLITSKNILKYLPETSLKYDVFDGTIEELKVAAETDERWKQSGVIYFVDPINASEELSDTNSKDEYLYIKNGETGSYEKIGSTRSDINILFSQNDIYNVTADDSNISFNNINGDTTKSLTFTANQNGYSINTNNGSINLVSSTNLAYDENNNIDTYYKGVSLGTYFSFYSDDAYGFDKLSIFNKGIALTENQSIRWFSDTAKEEKFFDVKSIKAADGYQLIWSSSDNLSYINFLTAVKFEGSVNFNHESLYIKGKKFSDIIDAKADKSELTDYVKTDDALYQKLAALEEQGILDKIIELVKALTIETN